MWQAMIFVGMLAMTGYYSVAKEVADPMPVSSVKSTELANSMAIYRETIVAYLHAHPGFEGQAIPDNEVQNALPSWYVMPRGKGSRSLWAHRVCPDGTVIVFANDATPVNITKDIVKVSKNSVTVGESLGDNAFYAPAKEYSIGHKTADLPSNASDVARVASGRVELSQCPKVAAGRPVWVASLH